MLSCLILILCDFVFFTTRCFMFRASSCDYGTYRISDQRRLSSLISRRLHMKCVRTVSPEPSLFAHIKYGSRQRVWPKIRRENQWIAAHACLKIESTEGDKCHNLMSRLIFCGFVFFTTMRFMFSLTLPLGLMWLSLSPMKLVVTSLGEEKTCYLW